jgi:hypothetical protein
MWAQVERTNKSSIHEQKIRCAYLSAEDGTGNPNGIPEENEDSMSPIDHKMDESVSPFFFRVRGRVMRSGQQRVVGQQISSHCPAAAVSPLIVSVECVLVF